VSLTDPTARSRRISDYIEPFAWVLALLALATSPLFTWIIDQQTTNDSQVGAWVACMMSYILACVLFGLVLYYSAKHRSGLGIAAYLVAYVAGLILILGAAIDPHTGLPDAFIPALVGWAVAVVLLVIYFSHRIGGEATLKNGVETTATVTSAGVNGMVNYVTHWRLVLKFKDQQGNDRWFHLGRTGYGYSVGQTFKIKYDPAHPGSRRRIVVLNPDQFN
jgi:hypothetical protein